MIKGFRWNPAEWRSRPPVLASSRWFKIRDYYCGSVLENIICTDNVNRIEILNTMIRKARRLALLRRERGCFFVHSTLGVLND